MGRKKKVETNQITSVTYKKSNELINQKGSGTLMSQKLFAIGVNNMHLDETNSMVAEVFTDDLKKLFGTRSNSLYSRVEALCDRETSGSTIFDWVTLSKDKENNEIEAISVVTDAKFKNGKLSIRYNNKLTDYLLDAQKDYTIFKLDEMVNMTSMHSFKLLEITRSAYFKEKSRNPGIDVVEKMWYLSELKMLLGIVNTKGDKQIRQELSKLNPDYSKIEKILNDKGYNMYREYKDFNKVVVKKAVNEINEKTEMFIEYKAVGRPTAAIRFYISLKKNDIVNGSIVSEKTIERALSDREKDDILEKVYLEMKDNFALRDAREICEYAAFNKTDILEAYNYMLNYKQDIQNKMAFMKSAIKEGYAKSNSAKRTKTNGTFMDFKRNEYDFDELEGRILDN